MTVTWWDRGELCEADGIAYCFRCRPSRSATPPAQGELRRARSPETGPSEIDGIVVVSLEADLRERLSSVDLVCEASISEELLEQAEIVARAHLRNHAFQVLARRLAATYATFVSMRGAERYDRNRLWPQLGVTSQSSAAGAAFLDALRTLNLPDFQEMVRQERARHYVAPALIHGGVPSLVAQRLVEKVEQLLRRGLVDGSEAVTLLRRDPELVPDLGRPTARLIQYVPEYAGHLIDAVIDWSSGSDRHGTRLPRHLRNALETGAAPRGRAARRIAVPTVTLDPWSGFGPEAALGSGDETWTIELDAESRIVRPGESTELRPARRAVAIGAGRRVQLWTGEVLWFGPTGRLVPADQPLPTISTVLCHRQARIQTADGAALDVLEEGIPLSGHWSNHRCFTVRAPAGATLVATRGSEGAGAGGQSWTVADDAPVELVGEPVPHVSCGDAPVFARLPRLRVGPGRAEVPLWITALDDPRRPTRLVGQVEVADGLVDLERHIAPDQAAHALVETRGPDGLRVSHEVVFVPGLTVDAPNDAIGPDARPTIAWRADLPHAGGSGRATAHVDSFEFAAPGLRGLSLSVRLPRLSWGLRTGRSSRLEIATSEIAISADDLLAEDVWLVVRCGRPANLALRLEVDGRQLQERPVRAHVRPDGQGCQVAFSLGPFRESIRHARGSQLRLLVSADGTTVVAAATEGAREAGREPSRAWSAATAPAAPDRRGWDDLPWWRRGRANTDASDIREAAWRSVIRLRKLPRHDQVVEFVRELGAASRRWSADRTGMRGGDEAWGVGGRDWATLRATADELWQLDGERYRTFLKDRGVESWARGVREALRHADHQAREQVELWSFGRAPQSDAIEGWAPWPWLERAMVAGRRSSGTDRYAASVLFQLLELAGGIDAAGPAVVQALQLTPIVTLQGVALLLELTRQGIPLTPVPEVEERADQPQQLPAAPPPDPRPPRRLPAPREILDELELQLEDRHLVWRLDEAYEPPIVRISSPKPPRAVALLQAQRDDHGTCSVEVPSDLGGPLLVTLGSSSLLEPGSAGVERPIEVAAAQPLAGAPIRVRHTSDVTAGMLDIRLQRVITSAVHRQPATREVEALFEDEQAALEAILRVIRTRARQASVLEALAIAVMPAAMLFSDLRVRHDDGDLMRRQCPVLWAVLVARAPSQWRVLGWTNPQRFDAGTTTFDDLVAMARASWAPAISTFTYGYPILDEERPRKRLAATLRRLQARGVPPWVTDIIRTTHRAVNDDQHSIEAVRLLLEAHRAAPQEVTQAMLLGLASVHATRADRERS